MRPVAILGIGQVPVDEHWDKTLRDLAGEAALAALQDAKREQVDGIFVGNMLSNLLVHQQHLGAMLADWLGLAPVAAVKIESACGSGGAAFRAALQAVASGELDSALAVGVEKMTETDSAQTTAGAGSGGRCRLGNRTRLVVCCHQCLADAALSLRIWLATSRLCSIRNQRPCQRSG
jgi:acetyl-CoA acetyltransferase